MSQIDPSLDERHPGAPEAPSVKRSDLPDPRRTTRVHGPEGRTRVGAYTDPQAWRARLTAGVVAGIFGGGLMLALIIPWTWSTGVGAWLVPKAIAATWYGLEALLGGPGVIAVGFVTHFLVAIFWGVLFAWLANRDLNYAAAAGSAMFYGFLVWLFMTYAFLPWVNPTLAIRVNTMPVAWFLGHLLFALPLVAVPWMSRALGLQRGRGGYSRHRETVPYGTTGTGRPVATHA